MKKTNVLIVDDDPVMVKLLTSSLPSTEYRTFVANDGEKGIGILEQEDIDLVLLDVMMPGVDGTEVCRTVRQWSPVPIIIVSAKARMTDKVNLLELGADDYITKPFAIEELLARMRATLRTSQKGEKEHLRAFSFDELEIDFMNQRVRCCGRDIDLTPTEFDLLKHLAQNENKVFTHRDLLTQVWGGGMWASYDSLRTHIRNLRRKIEKDPQNPKYIITRTGVGYYLRTL